MLSGGRIITAGYKSDEPNMISSLGFDYATVFGLYHFSGYEPLLPRLNRTKTLGLNYDANLSAPPDKATLEHLRVWGVRWHIVAPYAAANYGAATGLREIHRDSERVIFEDTAAMPLVFRLGESSPAGQAVAHGNTLDVTLADDKGGCVVLNWLYSDGMKVPGPATISALPTGHIQVCAEKGVKRFSVEYSSPYFKKGALLSLTALALISLTILLWP